MLFSLPIQTREEELANSLTHGFGFVLSTVGLGLLLTLAVLYGDARHIVSSAVYGSSLVFLYGASTLYHSIRRPRLKFIFRILDHVGILTLIAGTYTPFALVLLRDGIGWTVLSGIWGIALIGILFKIFSSYRFRSISILLYVGMGWAGVFVIDHLMKALPLSGILWIVAGGLCYTIGLIFFAWERLPYSHAIWHVFVLAGSICHYLAIVLYVLPG